MRSYLPPDDPANPTPHESRTFPDGTWRQPAPYLRDMARFRTSADRLRAMRAQYPAPLGAPADWTHNRGGCVGDPAYWFGAESPANVARNERGEVFYNYGDGIGSDIGPRRPFRFVGFCDECDGGPDHTGWFGNDEGDGYSTFRGTVFRIPARDGAERFLAGYEHGESTRRGFSPGFGSIDAGTVFDSERDAARCADSLAEYAAEREREYQREEAERIREEEEEAERREEEEEAERMALADVPTNGAD